ncbi:YceD family protein [Flavobacterium sp. RSB2_4_14]|uniref:YceD family protein n=1 Tax=Flavobacterium sp. RSB2_4_14 TaxID=3447665 RepID=UPI003F388FBB
MKITNEYLIPFIGLKIGKHQFDFKISKKFFDDFSFDEFESCDLAVNVVLEKKSTMLEINFKHKGTVTVPCDLTGELFDLPIKGKIKLVVQFGDEFNNDNDELLVLPHGEHQVDLSQYIYEMIVLSVPHKRVHPGVKDGTLQTEALKKLKELQVKEIKEEEKKEEEIDPRWDKLKQLLTDK